MGRIIAGNDLVNKLVDHVAGSFGGGRRRVLVDKTRGDDGFVVVCVGLRVEEGECVVGLCSGWWSGFVVVLASLEVGGRRGGERGGRRRFFFFFEGEGVACEETTVVG